ncbi:MAG: N-acetyl-gamma-glutamyl-phosphate reductase, partial [Clostridiales bacterium]|nr:N-acetyl-gamma-glutamyl-phosphate reductase [Clostridiales bacterium]
MKPKIYIDGQEGTTGLQIYDRLNKRDDIDLLLIDPEKRKDAGERKKLINSADIVIFCLPDDAAREAVAMIGNEKTRVIDASTAHRTAKDWDYGFPELSKVHREKIKASKRVANPGCHATGFAVSVYPLIQLGILPDDYPLTCFSLTGYSGGGKTRIREYEEEKTPGMFAPMLYKLDLQHKHLPEMVAVTGVKRTPVFCPVIDDYYKGMATTIMLHNDLLHGKQTAETVLKILKDYYGGERFVTVTGRPENGMLESNWGATTNNLQISVNGNEDRTIITARFDNLGKGASGAAVQNMNIMLGFDEAMGL